MLISSKSKLIRKMIMVKLIMSPFLVPGCFHFQKGEFNRFSEFNGSLKFYTWLIPSFGCKISNSLMHLQPREPWRLQGDLPWSNWQKMKVSCIQRSKSSNYYLSTHAEPIVTVSLNQAVNNYKEIWSGQNKTVAEKSYEHIVNFYLQKPWTAVAYEMLFTITRTYLRVSLQWQVCLQDYWQKQSKVHSTILKLPFYVSNLIKR